MKTPTEQVQALIQGEMARQDVTIGGLAARIGMDASNCRKAVYRETNLTLETVGRLAAGLERRIVCTLDRKGKAR